MVELRQLQYFVALSESRTFARAAENQHITQSALSQQIARLERDLGVVLFVRGAHGAVPTAAAAELLPQATRVLEAVTSLRASAASIERQASSRLRLGSPAYAVRSRARREVVGAFNEAFPHVDLEFTTAWSVQLLADLMAGDLDATFSMLAPECEDIEFLLVEEEPAVMLVPDDHTLAQRQAIELTDLAGECVSLYPRNVNAWMFDRLAARLTAAGVEVGEFTESALPAIVDQVRAVGMFAAVPWEVRFVHPDHLEGLRLVPTTARAGLLYGLWLARRRFHSTDVIDGLWGSAEEWLQHAATSDG